jgi:two-component system LytT family response regulator
MIKVSIIEDEPLLRAQLERYVRELPSFEVVSASADVATSATLIELHKPHIILSDIKLTDGDGFDVLLRIAHKRYALIFVTAYDEFAIKAIKFGAFDYILKPVDKAELHASLLRIASNSTIPSEKAVTQNSGTQYKTRDATRLIIRTTNITHFLDIADIVYCSSVGNYTTFVMKDGEKVMATKNIKEYELLLPAEIFVRTHQSYIINVRFVKQIRNDGTIILFYTAEPIPLSTRRREAVLNFLSRQNSN